MNNFTMLSVPKAQIGTIKWLLRAIQSNNGIKIDTVFVTVDTLVWTLSMSILLPLSLFDNIFFWSCTTTTTTKRSTNGIEYCVCYCRKLDLCCNQITQWICCCSSVVVVVASGLLSLLRYCHHHHWCFCFPFCYLCQSF